MIRPGAEEDPRARLLTNLVDLDAEEVKIGMTVHVRFLQVGDADERCYLPLFGPVPVASPGAR